MESNTERKPWTNFKKQYKKGSKEIKSETFGYRKVGSAITIWGATENLENDHFDRHQKIFVFWGHQ